MQDEHDVFRHLVIGDLLVAILLMGPILADEKDFLRQLERENRKLKRANEILYKASAFSAT